METNKKLIKQNRNLHQWYHQNSKITQGDKYQGINDFPIIPPRKDYSYTEKVNLSLPEVAPKMSLIETFINRKSTREFNNHSIDLNTLSTLLYFSDGVKSRVGGLYSKSYASAGSRYSSEIYIIANNVDDLEQGVYHYDSVIHQLDVVNKKSLDFSFLLDDSNSNNNSLFIVITSYFNGMTQKYGDRGYRYCLFDIGQICQNIYLTSTALNIGCFAIGGFYDNELENFIDIDGEQESSLLVMSIGDY